MEHCVKSSCTKRICKKCLLGPGFLRANPALSNGDSGCCFFCNQRSRLPIDVVQLIFKTRNLSPDCHQDDNKFDRKWDGNSSDGNSSYGSYGNSSYWEIGSQGSLQNNNARIQTIQVNHDAMGRTLEYQEDPEDEMKRVFTDHFKGHANYFYIDDTNSISRLFVIGKRFISDSDPRRQVNGNAVPEVVFQHEHPSLKVQINQLVMPHNVNESGQRMFFEGPDASKSPAYIIRKNANGSNDIVRINPFQDDNPQQHGGNRARAPVTKGKASKGSYRKR